MTALVVVAAGTALAPAAADPPGTVNVNRVQVRTPEIEVLGASPAGVLYRAMRDPKDPESATGTMTYLKPTGKPPIQVANGFKYLVGNKIYNPRWDGLAVSYQLIGNTTVQTCTTAPARANTSNPGAAFTSFGWLTASGQRVMANATGCTVTGSGPAIPDFTLGAADSTGYVLIDGDLTYHAYASPDKPQKIQTGGRDLYPHGMDLAGTTVTWAANHADAKQSYVVRSSTTGGPAKVTQINRHVENTAISSTATGWSACRQGRSGGCAPAVGSISATGVGTEVVGSRSVASDGTRFFVDRYGASPGVDAAAVLDGKTWTRIAAVALLLPHTWTVDASAGGVAFVDDRAAYDSGPPYQLGRRPVSNSGGKLTLGTAQNVGPVGEFAITRDGDRTAYTDGANDLWIVTDGGVKTKIFDSTAKVSQVQTWWMAPFSLSGHRLLWIRADYTGDFCQPSGCTPTYDKWRLMMYDLRTGKNVDLGPTSELYPSALWGNYLVTTDANYRILRKDLGTGATVQVRGAGPRIDSVDVNGSIVAWSTSSKVGYRIVSGGTPAVERDNNGYTQVSLTGGHLAYTTQAGDTYTLKTWRLGTTSTTVIGTSYVFDFFTSFETHDETLAWIGTDRIARVSPLAPFAARPRYLGNASGAATFKPSAGQVWSPSFPISKALPTCAIVIKAGSTVKRSLPCATTIGIARAKWDGKDSAGRLVAKGKYSWTLTGSDTDGGLLWWNGSAAPISGSITVA